MLMTLLLVARTALDVTQVPSNPCWFPHSLCIAKLAVLYLPQQQKERMISNMSGHKGLSSFPTNLHILI